MFFMEDILVEAIEEGKIVSVRESYAKREGLLILRRVPPSINQQNAVVQQNARKHARDEGHLLFDDFRKPLRVSAGSITQHLVPNFHWIIREKRRVMGITRKKCSRELGISENDLKLLENGIFPSNDFGLATRLGEYFGTQIIKSEANALKQDMRKLVEKPRVDEKTQRERLAEEASNEFSGKDLELDI